MPAVPQPPPGLTAAQAGPKAQNLAQAQAQIGHWQQVAGQAGLALRAPPPEPLGCCGRGCSGCVWQGFYDALQFWLEDAQTLVQAGTLARQPMP